MDLTSVTKIREAFYRLVGTDASDTALTDQTEAVDDVAYLFLTRGTRAAQDFLIGEGYAGWRKDPTLLTVTGTSDAGQTATLPTDFLRAVGNQRVSCLRMANGDQWGQEVDNRDETKKGDGFCIRGDKIKFLRSANVPSPIYLEYFYMHPEWTSGVTIDFPLLMRPLLIAEAADQAKYEDWLLGDADMLQKISFALQQARSEGRKFAKRSQQPSTWRAPRRAGTHW